MRLGRPNAVEAVPFWRSAFLLPLRQSSEIVDGASQRRRYVRAWNIQHSVICMLSSVSPPMLLQVCQCGLDHSNAVTASI